MHVCIEIFNRNTGIVNAEVKVFYSRGEMRTEKDEKNYFVYQMFVGKKGWNSLH